MKKLFASFIMLLACAAAPAFGQIQVGLNGAHLHTPIAGVKFSDGSWGGGLSLKYFLSRAFAVGFNARYFPKNIDYNGAKIAVSIIPVTAELNYFILPGSIRPYLGVEGGLYMARVRLAYQGTSQSESDRNFGVAPKAGLQFGLGQNLALNLGGSYHLTFVDGEIGKDLLLEAGVAFNLGN